MPIGVFEVALLDSLGRYLQGTHDWLALVRSLIDAYRARVLHLSLREKRERSIYLVSFRHRLPITTSHHVKRLLVPRLTCANCTGSLLLVLLRMTRNQLHIVIANQSVQMLPDVAFLAWKSVADR